MTLLQRLSLAAILAPATLSVAASIPKTILPDNVIRCEPDTGCLSETVNGHNYKVLNTPRFTVMVAVSHEGIYTRADVSITNKTDMPLNISPDDFRVEVLTPKPKVHNYISPANLVLPPPPPPKLTPTPQPAAAPTPTPQSPEPQSQVVQTPASQPAAAPPASAETEANPAPPTAETEVLYVAVKEKAAQDDAQKAASENHLSATSIPPNEATSGRVYFARDKHAHLVNVCLPIAGVVFEFPYAMKK
jgi:hypothetical protein